MSEKVHEKMVVLNSLYKDYAFTGRYVMIVQFYTRKSSSAFKIGHFYRGWEAVI